jgi:hypothetical protein
MSRSNWTLESVDGDFEPCSVSEFIDANRETFSAAEIRAIRKLRPGQQYSGGGGAWGDFTIRRQAELKRNGLSPAWMVALAIAAAGGIYFGTRRGTVTPLDARTEYGAAVREFASAKGFHQAALLRKTDHPGDAAILAAYDAAAARLAAATTRIEAARAEMIRLGLST